MSAITDYFEATRTSDGYHPYSLHFGYADMPDVPCTLTDLKHIRATIGKLLKQEALAESKEGEER